MSTINEAHERMIKGDVKYRFVLDIKTLRVQGRASADATSDWRVVDRPRLAMSRFVMRLCFSSHTHGETGHSESGVDLIENGVVFEHGRVCRIEPGLVEEVRS